MSAADQVSWTPAKAIAAGIVTAFGALVATIQAIVTDDGVSSDEWVRIATAAAVFVAAVAAVYQTRNRPTTTPPDVTTPAPAPPT